MTSFWLCPLHACWSNPQWTTALLLLSLNTSLISLCLMSGTTELTSRENPPSTTFLNLFSTTPFIDLPKAVMGVSRFMQKKPSLLADDCQLKHSLWLDPWGQLEPLGHCTCRDFKVVTLHWNWGNVFEWRLEKVKMCEWENSSCCIKDWQRMMRFRHKHYSISSGWFPNLYWVLLSLKGEGSVHCQMLLSDPLRIPR